MKKLLIILFLILSMSAFSQQDPMFTHYMENTLAINPAYAGSRDALTLLALHRSQWIGFDGAPVTQTLTMHTPVFTPNTGLGLSVINDKIGPLNQTSFFVDFSYRIKFKTSYLAFGLKSGVNILQVPLSELHPANPNDPAYSTDYKSDLMPNFGTGIYYYSDRYYFGISVPKILQNNLFTNSVNQDLIKAVRHYFFIAGTYFSLSENLKLKPTTFVKYTPSAPIEADITATFIYRDILTGGFMYRTGDALGVLIGAYITPQITIGYSYDWSTTNKTGKYNAGSHEVLVRYDFFIINKKKIRSPRYF